MKSMTIAFDVDGVLRDLVGYTIRHLTDSGFLVGKSISDVDRYDAFVELLGGKDKWRAVLDDINAWKIAEAHREMVRLWHDLQGIVTTEPIKLIIVTSNSHKIGQLQTIDWLYEHLNPEKGLDIHFVNDKLAVKWDAIIEDSPRNALLAAMQGRMAFLVNRPWTADEGKWMFPEGPYRYNPAFLVRLPPSDVHADSEPFLQCVLRKLEWYDGYMMAKGERAGEGR